jgi:predicted RNA-binding Zn ribbon-like protein
MNIIKSKLQKEAKDGYVRIETLKDFLQQLMLANANEIADLRSKVLPNFDPKSNVDFLIARITVAKELLVTINPSVESGLAATSKDVL